MAGTISTGPPDPLSPVTVANPVDDEVELLCDSGAGNTQFLRRYDYSGGGAPVVTNTTLDGATVYVPVGPVVRCSAVTVGNFPAVQPVSGTVTVGNQLDDEYVVLCDTVGPFIRRYRADAAGAVTVANFTLAGAGYAPVGAVGSCSDTVNNFPSDREYELLCDAGAANTPFLRRYNVTSAGVVTVTDTTLNGTTAYVPVGAVVRCPTSIGAIASAGTNTASVIITRVFGAFPAATAQRLTSALARRVTILWENNTSSVATRPSINGVPLFQQSSQGGGSIVIGDLVTSGTVPVLDIRTNLATDDLTVVEEL